MAAAVGITLPEAVAIVTGLLFRCLPRSDSAQVQVKVLLEPVDQVVCFGEEQAGIQRQHGRTRRDILQDAQSRDAGDLKAGHDGELVAEAFASPGEYLARAGVFEGFGLFLDFVAVHHVS